MTVGFAGGNAEKILEKYLPMISDGKIDRNVAKEFGKAVLSVEDETKRNLGVQALCCHVIHLVCDSKSDSEDDAVSDIFLGFLKGFQWIRPSIESIPISKKINEESENLLSTSSKLVFNHISQLEKYIKSRSSETMPSSNIKIDYRVTLSQLEALIEVNPDITYLEVVDCINVRNAAVLHKVPKVVLGAIIISEEEFKTLLQWSDQSIVKVQMYWTGFNSQHLNKLIKVYPHLVELTLILCSHVSDCSPIGSLRKITELHLLGCENVDDISFLTTLTSLTRFSLTGRNSVTDFSSLKQLPELKELCLAFHSNLTNESLDQISKLRGLSVLDLSYCPGITDSNSISLHKLNGLTSLNLSGCKNIKENDGLFEALKTNLPRIRILKVGNRIQEN